MCSILLRHDYVWFATDIADGPQYDFLTVEPWFDFNVIVSNPPFPEAVCFAPPRDRVRECHQATAVEAIGRTIPLFHQAHNVF